MRYDTPIYFQKVSEGEYDPKTGDYGSEQLSETEVFASVMDTGTETMTLVYGGLRQGSVTAHIQNAYTDAFSSVRIEGRIYRVDYTRRLRSKQVFVLSEVQ